MAHGKSKCDRKVDQWIGSGLNNIHRCPKCASTFEKVSGCPHTTCAICKHRWCWTCGTDLKSSFHEKFMGMPCEVLNEVALGTCVPNILKPLLAILTLILLPPLLLFFGVIGLILEAFKESFYSYNIRTKKAGPLRKRFFCDSPGKSCLCNLIVFILFFLPFWLILLAIMMAISCVIFVLAIVPAYLFSIFAFCKMLCWWTRNKKLDNDKLT